MDEKLKSSPKSVDMIIMLADFYIQNNLIDQAIEVLNSILGETKEYIKVYIKLIEAYLMKGDEDNAKKILEKGKRIDPENQEIKELEDKLTSKISLIPEVEKDISVEIADKKIEVTEKEETIPEEKLEVKEEEKGILPLKAILKQMCDKNDDIMGTILIDETGILIAEELKIYVDVESTAAMIASVYSDIDYVIKKIKLGLFEYMFFDFPKGRLLALYSKPVIFVILASKNAELGMLMLEGKETFEKLKVNLGL